MDSSSVKFTKGQRNALKPIQERIVMGKNPSKEQVQAALKSGLKSEQVNMFVKKVREMLEESARKKEEEMREAAASKKKKGGKSSGGKSSKSKTEADDEDGGSGGKDEDGSGGEAEDDDFEADYDDVDPSEDLKDVDFDVDEEDKSGSESEEDAKELAAKIRREAKKAAAGLTRDDLNTLRRRKKDEIATAALGPDDSDNDSGDDASDDGFGSEGSGLSLGFNRRVQTENFRQNLDNILTKFLLRMKSEFSYTNIDKRSADVLSHIAYTIAAIGKSSAPVHVLYDIIQHAGEIAQMLDEAGLLKKVDKLYLKKFEEAAAKMRGDPEVAAIFKRIKAESGGKAKRQGREKQHQESVIANSLMKRFITAIGKNPGLALIKFSLRRDVGFMGMRDDDSILVTAFMVSYAATFLPGDSKTKSAGHKVSARINNIVIGSAEIDKGLKFPAPGTGLRAYATISGESVWTDEALSAELRTLGLQGDYYVNSLNSVGYLGGMSAAERLIISVNAHREMIKGVKGSKGPLKFPKKTFAYVQDLPSFLEYFSTQVGNPRSYKASLELVGKAMAGAN